MPIIFFLQSCTAASLQMEEAVVMRDNAGLMADLRETKVWLQLPGDAEPIRYSLFCKVQKGVDKLSKTVADLNMYYGKYGNYGVTKLVS